MSAASAATGVAERARVSARIAALLGSRPATGASDIDWAAWLREKAGVHEAIAARLREIGDIPGAVEAEVLASRAWTDAADLLRIALASSPTGVLPPARPSRRAWTSAPSLTGD